MKAKDTEKAIVADGWYNIKSEGHRQYKHHKERRAPPIQTSDQSWQSNNTLAQEWQRRPIA
jgi:hypothetical protein